MVVYNRVLVSVWVYACGCVVDASVLVGEWRAGVCRSESNIHMVWWVRLGRSCRHSANTQPQRAPQSAVAANPALRAHPWTERAERLEQLAVSQQAVTCIRCTVEAGFDRARNERVPLPHGTTRVTFHD